MLFIDYSSEFNTIVPSKIIIKLEALGLNPALCNWVLNFLKGRPQVVKVRNNISTSLTLNTGAPQGCVLSPLLYSLFTHDCVAKHASNSIIKFTDNTTVVGLIPNNDETAYREEVRALGVWCQENNLSLNINKTKEIIKDFRKQQREQPPIHIEVPRRTHHRQTEMVHLHIQWGKTVFTQPPIVQVLPLKKIREACNFQKKKNFEKKNPENHIVGFLMNLFANYGGK